MWIQSYYNRQIADIIISYANEPSVVRETLLGEDEKEVIASVFDARAPRKVAFEIEKMFACPLSLNLIDDPVLTNCGHTFSTQSLTDSMVKRPFRCPIDRTEIKFAIDDHLLKAVIEKIKNLLQAREQLITVDLWLNSVCRDYRTIFCPGSGTLLTDGVVFSCGCKWNTNTIGKLMRQGSRACWEHNQLYSFERAKIDIKTSQAAQKYLMGIKRFNETAVVQNIEKFKKLDGRFQIDQQIVQEIRQLYRCPIGKYLLKDPVTCSNLGCGHTFDRGSIQNGAVCPIDQRKITELIPNFLIKSHLEMLSQFDPTYELEALLPRGVDDLPDIKYEQFGFKFYATPAMKFEDLWSVLTVAHVVTAQNMGKAKIWPRHALGQPYELFRGGTLQGWIEACRKAGAEVCKDSNINLYVMNEFDPPAALEKMMSSKT